MVKSQHRKLATRAQRRAHIKRGMKIMLYEINQRLARYDVQLIVPPDFYKYTVAIAEGGRDEADLYERLESVIRQKVSGEGREWRLIRNK